MFAMKKLVTRSWLTQEFLTLPLLPTPLALWHPEKCLGLTKNRMRVTWRLLNRAFWMERPSGQPSWQSQVGRPRTRTSTRCSLACYINYCRLPFGCCHVTWCSSRANCCDFLSSCLFQSSVSDTVVSISFLCLFHFLRNTFFPLQDLHKHDIQQLRKILCFYLITKCSRRLHMYTTLLSVLTLLLWSRISRQLVFLKLLESSRFWRFNITIDFIQPSMSQHVFVCRRKKISLYWCFHRSCFFSTTFLCYSVVVVVVIFPRVD